MQHVTLWLSLILPITNIMICLSSQFSTQHVHKYNTSNNHIHMDIEPSLSQIGIMYYETVQKNNPNWTTAIWSILIHILKPTDPAYWLTKMWSVLGVDGINNNHKHNDLVCLVSFPLQKLTDCQLSIEYSTCNLIIIISYLFFKIHPCI